MHKRVHETQKTPSKFDEMPKAQNKVCMYRDGGVVTFEGRGFAGGWRIVPSVLNNPQSRKRGTGV